MADTGSISTSGEAELFISEAAITEAVKVIRPIPKLPTETATNVRFTVRRGGHCASIHVVITPFHLRGTTNRGFRASCRATPCHPAFDDSELYDQIQKVYDAIVPVQWTFNSDWLGTRFPIADFKLTLSLSTEIIREPQLTSDVPGCQHKTPYLPLSVGLNGGNQAPQSSLHSRRPPPSSLPRKRYHNEASFAPGDAIASAAADPKRPKSIQNIADNFVSLIIDGQEQLKKKRHLPGIQAILSRREQEDTSALSTEFRRESKQKGIKSDYWDYWYFEGCMDLVNRKSTGAARAVRLVNSVVNTLLVTDGAIALVIFGALAETGSRLTYISRAAAQSRDTIVSLAVQHLHKKLHPPPSWYQIPNAAVWVALVKNRSGSGTPVYSFQDACRDLALPNLAALDLKPQWVEDPSSRTLLMKVDFSLVEASWMATGVNAQQSMGSESETTQPGSRSASDSDGSSNPHEAGPVTPVAHAGPSFGDGSGQELAWSAFDLEGVANMGSIDFGCTSIFGLGSSDGVMHR